MIARCHKEVIPEGRQDAILWWDQDSNLGFSITQSAADWTPADKPTELSRIK